MGFLRILLAYGVLAEHSEVPFIVGSYTAVQAFFIVSGFYMSLILSGRYSSVHKFFSSRAMRLFPVYWAAVISAVIWYIVAAAFFETETLAFDGIGKFVDANILIQIWYLTSNLFFVGSDVGFHFLWGDLPAIYYILMPPVWTLSLEVLFYLLCPLLMGWRSRYLLLLIVGALGLRVLGYSTGLDGDPWHARFFPFEIAFFVAGILSHRVYCVILNRHGFTRELNMISFAAILSTFLIAIFFYPLANALGLPKLYGLHDYILSLLFYALILISLPMLFHWTRHNRWDRYIGEYSYTVYLFHYVFVEIFINADLAEKWNVNGLLIVSLLTFTHAALANHFIQFPLDRLRHRLFKPMGGIYRAT